MKTFPLLAALWLGLVVSAAAQPPKPSSTPLGDTDPKRAGEVDQRGDEGMGFNHDMTTHHFRLLPDGGAIEVEANDPGDAASREAIRSHLKMIAGLFAKGDFSLPMFIHSTVPPGVKTMKRLKDRISYTSESTPLGGQVRMTTKSPKALAAIHEFLRFQIKDHRTNDPLEVPRS